MMHSIFIYSFKLEFCRFTFDLDFGLVARDSGDSNMTFHQLINDKRTGPNEVDIFMDGSKSSNQNGITNVDCAIYCPQKIGCCKN